MLVWFSHIFNPFYAMLILIDNERPERKKQERGRNSLHPALTTMTPGYPVLVRYKRLPQCPHTWLEMSLPLSTRRA